MPFKSEKQRRYLWKNEPKIAKEWTKAYGSKPIKKKRTPKELKASRDESYGKWGSGKGRGKINK